MASFDKYKERGSYHWHNVYGVNFLRRNPSKISWYDVPVHLVKQHTKGIHGVDVGCGDGVLIERASRQGLRVIGVDSSIDGLDLARGELRKHSVAAPLVCASVYEIPLPSHSVDYVTSVEVIEHMNDVEAYLSEIARILKPEGVFVCTTPQRFSPDVNSVRDPYHVHEFTPEELHDSLCTYFDGVVIKGIQPAWLTNLYKGMTHIRVVDTGIRVAFRLFAGIWNPFSQLVTADPKAAKCHTLVGIGTVKS